MSHPRWDLNPQSSNPIRTLNHLGYNTGPLFTKRADVLLQDLMKSWSREIRVYTFAIALKPDRHLGSTAAEMPAKFQRDVIIITSNLAASRLRKIWWSCRLVNRGPGSGDIDIFASKVKIITEQGQQNSESILSTSRWRPISLKRKCHHFDESFITGCTESCHFDNFRCSQWWRFHQNEDIFVSVYGIMSMSARIRFIMFLDRCVSWWYDVIETLSMLLVLCVRGIHRWPVVSLKGVGNAGFGVILETADQTDELLVIWDTMTFMWRKSNAKTIWIWSFIITLWWMGPYICLISTEALWCHILPLFLSRE